MAERVYSQWDRETALWQAEREGDKAAAETWGCSEATIRSWRHRTERKVTDLRASASDASGEHEAIGDGLVEVQVTTDEWNGALGCAVKVAGRARVVERFQLGGQFVSQGERRELRGVASEIASTLGPGDLLLLGAERFARFGDALWCVVSREGAALMVRPAKVRRDERLSDDRSRIVAKSAADDPRWKDRQRQRLNNINDQVDEQERRMRLAREALTQP